MSDPLSLYVHVPFCRRKCRYCDFYSVETPGLIPAWVDSLCREIRLRSQGRRTRPGTVCSTLYFGGGTPSLLTLAQAGRIMQVMRDHFYLAPDAEITVEANPGTVDQAYLKGLRELGVNRLSMGTQSFDPEKLSFLGRIHTPSDNLRVVEAARTAGFDNIGLDLIYALPRETETAWQRDLASAAGLEPEHLSCYMLTVEPGTPLHKSYEAGGFRPCGPDRRTDLFLCTSRYLEQNGYQHYEVSNFAKGAGKRSRHNANYWNLTPYLGFGPSAHSFGFPGNGLPVRSWNRADVKGYMRCLSEGRLPLEGEELLSPAQQLLERVMLGLRTRDGMDAGFLDARFDRLRARLAADGFGFEETGRLCLTRAGLARLDSIVEAFAGIIL